MDFGLSSERADLVDPFDVQPLALDHPVQLVASWPGHSWRTYGRLVTASDRRIARIEVEFSAWSADATELSLRPAANHPERWTGRYQCRYFEAAHRAADGVLAVVNARCVRLRPRPRSRSSPPTHVRDSRCAFTLRCHTEVLGDPAQHPRVEHAVAEQHLLGEQRAEAAVGAAQRTAVDAARARSPSAATARAASTRRRGSGSWNQRLWSMLGPPAGRFGTSTCPKPEPRSDT